MAHRRASQTREPGSAFLREGRSTATLRSLPVLPILTHGSLRMWAAKVKLTSNSKEGEKKWAKVKVDSVSGAREEEQEC